MHHLWTRSYKRQPRAAPARRFPGPRSSAAWWLRPSAPQNANPWCVAGRSLVCTTLHPVFRGFTIGKRCRSSRRVVNYPGNTSRSALRRRLVTGLKQFTYTAHSASRVSCWPFRPGSGCLLTTRLLIGKLGRALDCCKPRQRLVLAAVTRCPRAPDLVRICALTRRGPIPASVAAHLNHAGSYGRGIFAGLEPMATDDQWGLGCSLPCRSEHARPVR